MISEISKNKLEEEEEEEEEDEEEDEDILPSTPNRVDRLGEI
jgi:hypothetical protein